MVQIRFTGPGEKTYEVAANVGDSLMKTAMDHDVPGILADCGGGLACATCHVYIAQDWFAQVGPPDESEEEMLGMAIDPGPTSRLSCQVIITDELDGLEVLIPKEQA